MSEEAQIIANPDIALAWTTVGKREDAERIARNLIRERLAFCVQIDPAIHSHYRWQGEVHADPEFRIWIKFSKVLAKTLYGWIQANHPYDVPQWIVVDVLEAGAAYARWGIAGSHEGAGG